MKYLFFVIFGSVFLLSAYAYHQQLAGHHKERVICWQKGGILWHKFNGDIVCIVINKED